MPPLLFKIFLLLLGSVSFCSGQDKLVKTQGASVYNNVHCGVEDARGHLWFATTGEGVYRYDGKNFKQYTMADGLSSLTVWSAAVDRSGDVWFGTNNGVCRYNGKSITCVAVPLSRDGYFYSHNTSAQEAATSFDVWSIFQDKGGRLWFATTEGVFIYQGTGFTRFTVKDGSARRTAFLDNRVEYILQDKTGNYWLGGRGNEGVFRYDGKSLQRFNPDGHGWLWPVLEDKTGMIWFSNWSGAWGYNGKTFTNITKTHELCGSHNITRITEDRNGIIWIGSDNGGICRYDGKTSTHFSSGHGLRNNSVWTILEDRTGHLWIGTRNTGLYRFDGKSFIPFSH